jgi:hypothetical protein
MAQAPAGVVSAISFPVTGVSGGRTSVEGHQSGCLDGGKLRADASKSNSVSYKRLGELEACLREEVQQFLALGEQVAHGEHLLPEGLVIQDEVARRQNRLANLTEAKAVLKARARERDAHEQAV